MRPGQCPVCRAAFRGVLECPRCGADLSRLMALTARAWRLRLDAAEALRKRDYAGAAELAGTSERIVHTPRGAALMALAGWLAALEADRIAAQRREPSFRSVL